MRLHEYLSEHYNIQAACAADMIMHPELLAASRKTTARAWRVEESEVQSTVPVSREKSELDSERISYGVGYNGI